MRGIRHPLTVTGLPLIATPSAGAPTPMPIPRPPALKSKRKRCWPTVVYVFTVPYLSLTVARKRHEASADSPVRVTVPVPVAPLAVTGVSFHVPPSCTAIVTDCTVFALSPEVSHFHVTYNFTRVPDSAISPASSTRCAVNDWMVGGFVLSFHFAYRVTLLSEPNRPPG